MALPDDFNKIFGSTATGGITPINDVNYAKGWEYVGSNPPTKNDFSYLQNLSDLKSQWLYSNKLQRTNPFGDIKSDGTVQAALSNLGLGTAATSDVSDYTPAGQAYTKSESNGRFQPLDSTLTALATLVGAANKLPYFNGAKSAALTDLTAVGRDIIGKSTIADILTYLGLGEGSALPVGAPIPWPSATPPTGWLKCNGAAFTASQYPKLALAYPALRLPDLRGEFIRGWDDGRGVDAGRSLLSSQDHAFQQHTHTYTGLRSVTDCDRGSYSSTWSIDDTQSYTTSGATGSTATETRPRNVAFNYIVRAA